MGRGCGFGVRVLRVELGFIVVGFVGSGRILVVLVSSGDGVSFLGK